MSKLTDLWPRVREIVSTAERPSRYINHEWGSVYKEDADFHFCMVYPDVYEVGQPNQALRILVNVVNAREGLSAERGFLPAPDMADKMRAEGIPMFSIESCAPLAEFDAVGVTLSHELVATNVLEMLDLSGIPLHADDRSEDDPFVIAGGPCAYNPEPYAPFFDAFCVGEGEVMLPDGLEFIRNQRKAGATRAEVLRKLATEPGWYVPSLYRWRDTDEAQAAGSWIEPLEEGLPIHIEKQLFTGFAESPGWEPCIVPFAEAVHDRLNVEILRGCARGCRFCQAGMTYRPVRERPADQIVAAVMRGLACTGYDQVSLTSLSTTDHSNLEDVLRRLNANLSGKGISVSLPSERLDSFGVEMAKLVAGEKKGGLTFAPEAGTQRMRDVINKGVTEDDLMNAVSASFSQGWLRMKLYFMIGLPTETDEDVLGIAELCRRALELARASVPPSKRCAVRIGTSVAVFIPKAQTAFQWCGQTPPEEVRRRQKLLADAVPRGVDLRYHDYASSFLEAVLSRSGREALPLILEAHRLGARFDAWSDQFKLEIWQQAAENVGFDMQRAACEPFEVGGPLPWDHISAGVSPRWLEREWERALEGTLTPDCTMTKCSGCGVCPSLHVDNDLERSRA